MNKPLLFTSRTELRGWLSNGCLPTDGFWLLFGKVGGSKTLKAGETLEEALRLGWIDGQMWSLDDRTYRKYFPQRRESSKWPEENKTLVKQLEQKGLMTDYDRQRIEETKKNGRWNASKSATITGGRITVLTELLQNHELAHTNFLLMPPSVKKAYIHAYYDAKTGSGREKRLAWMVERLNKNLKPM